MNGCGCAGWLAGFVVRSSRLAVASATGYLPHPSSQLPHPSSQLPHPSSQSCMYLGRHQARTRPLRKHAGLDSRHAYFCCGDTGPPQRGGNSRWSVSHVTRVLPALPGRSGAVGTLWVAPQSPAHGDQGKPRHTSSRSHCPNMLAASHCVCPQPCFEQHVGLSVGKGQASASVRTAVLPASPPVPECLIGSTAVAGQGLPAASACFDSDSVHCPRQVVAPERHAWCPP